MFLGLWVLGKSGKTDYYLIHQCAYEGKVWWKFSPTALNLDEMLLCGHMKTCLLLGTIQWQKKYLYLVHYLHF